MEGKDLEAVSLFNLFFSLKTRGLFSVPLTTTVPSVTIYDELRAGQQLKEE